LYVADRYAPVLYGRNLPTLGGPFQSAITDTPLVAWHEITPAGTPGHSLIEYSVVWSNEDSGTDTPALMAHWGRSTDIEWVYRVEVDQDGNSVAGSGFYQAANHQTPPFAGQYDGSHPLLETCTSNNNMCDTVDDPMRFALSTRDVRPVELPVFPCARSPVMPSRPGLDPALTAAAFSARFRFGCSCSTCALVSRRAWSSRRLLSPRRPGTCACGTEPDRTALLRDLEGVDRCRCKTEIAARYRDGCRSKWRRRCLSSAAIRQMSAVPGHRFKRSGGS
jgi:hypothetical protein